MSDEIDIMEWRPVPEIEGKGALTLKERLMNIRANCASPMKRLDRELPAHGQTAIIVCYGPSIKKTWQDAVRESRALGAPIISVSGAHDFLIERDCVPQMHIEFDPREERARFTKEPHKDTLYLIASRCHPSVRKRVLGYKALLWHALQGAEENGEIQRKDRKDTGILVPGGACVGLRAITIAHTLGFRTFSIYGFDCSYADGEEWAGAHPGKTKADLVQVRSDGKVFTTSPIYTIYARQFLETYGKLNDSDFRLHGDGLLQTMANAYAKRLNQVEIAA